MLRIIAFNKLRKLYEPKQFKELIKKYKWTDEDVASIKLAFGLKPDLKPIKKYNKN